MSGTGILIVFAGLPGTGKTTLSRLLAVRLGAAHLRIDAIEQAMHDAGIAEPGAAGYAVAQALAAQNLLLGRAVVADCVNPVAASRAGWRRVADGAGVPLADIQLVCSDPAEHRRRITSRVADIETLRLPNWAEVTRRPLEPRDDEHLVLDTAHMAPVALVERCLAYIATRG